MDAEVAISAVLGPADYASGIRALDLSANYSYWRAYTKEHREDPTDISPESIVAIRAINEVEKMCVANLRANPGVLDSAVSDPEDYWLVRTMPTHLINQVLTEKMSKPAQ
jgi:hypothetical protein